MSYFLHVQVQVLPDLTCSHLIISISIVRYGLVVIQLVASHPLSVIPSQKAVAVRNLFPFLDLVVHTYRLWSDCINSWEWVEGFQVEQITIQWLPFGKDGCIVESLQLASPLNHHCTNIERSYFSPATMMSSFVVTVPDGRSKISAFWRNLHGICFNIFKANALPISWSRDVVSHPRIACRNNRFLHTLAPRADFVLFMFHTLLFCCLGLGSG